VSKKQKKYMKTKEISSLLFFLVVLLTIQGINAQSLYNIGGHSLLISDGNYYEVVNSNSIPITTDMILVRFMNNPEESFISTFESLHSLSFAHVTKSGIYRFDVSSSKNFIDLVTELSNDESISDFNLNQLIPYMSSPNDSYLVIEGELNYQPNLLWPYVNTHLFEAWDIESGDPSVIVCVLDNGMYIDHEDLNYGPDNYSNIWTNTFEIPDNNDDDDKNGFVDDCHGWNFVYDNNNLFCDSWQGIYDQHGTILSGIISAKSNNDIGIYGVAGGFGHPGAKVLPLYVGAHGDGVSTAVLPAAVEYAIKAGAKIINMSFGMSEPLPSLVESALQDAYFDDDIVLLAGAGDKIYGNGEECIQYPAKYDFVIAVGATEQSTNNFNDPEKRWTANGGLISTIGSELELMAPAEAFHTIYDNYFQTSGYTFITNDGAVSYATAFASGVVALMRSFNPCLTNEEIREILRNTNDKIGEVEYVSGHNKYYGYGRVNALAALEACSGSASPDIINTTENWTGEKNLYFDVNIQANGELNITNCNVRAIQNVKIIVEPGGKLIVNNSTLTSLCNVYWKGIEVWGNREEHQWPNSSGVYMQGYVELNNATIENAICALELWKPGDYTKTGGIAIATNSDFKNNTRTVHALHYINHHPNFDDKPMDYQAIFTDCTFDITDAYNPAYSFYKHIDLNAVNGVRFFGCDFSLSPEAQGISNYNQAIASYSSGFKVDAICKSIVSPCTQYDHSTFTGFYAAINASNGSLSPYTFRVNRANFTGNSIGIKVNGVKNESILFCNFNLGTNTKDLDACEKGASSFGIDMVGSIGFVIEENTFQKMQGAPIGLYTGIRCTDSKTFDDVIYKNTFTGLSYGNYAEGMNRPEKDNDLRGLKFECNINQNNAIDFVVAGIGSPQIHSFQGTSSLEAGNTFSANPLAEGNFKNMGTQVINYFYDTNPPIYYTDKFVVPIDEAIGNNCLSNHGGGSGTIEVLTESQKLQKELDYATNLSNFNDVKTLFDNLKDGGNTTELKLEVESSWPQDTWELRTKLLGKSPHLSEEVLKAAANKTEVLPESILFEILSANPDELRKETLIEYLENKEQPLPEYMISILKQLAGGITYKTVLMQDMARYESLKTSAATDLIRSNLNDDVIDLQYLRNWYDNLNNLNADYEIVATYLAEKDYTSAQTMLELIPTVRELSGNDLLDYEAYSSLILLQMQWEQQILDIKQIDDATVTMLEGIAGNERGRAAMLAQSILEYAKDYHFCHCLAETNETLLKNGQIISTPTENGLTIYATPNPANDWVAFNYTLPVNSTDGILKITDMSGKLVEQFTVSNPQGQKVWDTRQVNKGLYLYTLQAGNASKQGKLVIQ
jgi:hypothetical protein